LPACKLCGGVDACIRVAGAAATKLRNSFVAEPEMSKIMTEGQFSFTQ